MWKTVLPPVKPCEASEVLSPGEEAGEAEQWVWLSDMWVKNVKVKKCLNYHVKSKHQVMLWSGSNFFLWSFKHTTMISRRTWMCLTCCTTFSSFNLVRHYKEIIHADGKPINFTCNQCLELFPSKKVMMEHRIKLHHNEAYACHICDKVFPTANKLYMHKNFEHLDYELSYPADVARYLERKLYWTNINSHHSNIKILIRVNCYSIIQYKNAIHYGKLKN